MRFFNLCRSVEFSLPPQRRAPYAAVERGGGSVMAQAAWACLAACLSPDPAVQRPAEAQLRDWEAQPGFCSALAVRARDACAACRGAGRSAPPHRASLGS